MNGYPEVKQSAAASEAALSAGTTVTGSDNTSAVVCFLNIGWGDSDCNGLPSGLLTLIDGEDGSPPPCKQYGLEWMEQEGAEQLDMLILTHLHEDHLMGLLPLAAAKRITEAVLRYEPVDLTSLDALSGWDREDLFVRQVHKLLDSYLQLIRTLERPRNVDCLV
ncbi:hypothetical protein DNH61_12825 [Paenibacillus sambharensis]|uniref:Metallo-beta-lactamase domain-containing protein n=1 Tax=Paenibacillus sambharensis TaxID=1803190 RepID=A0A2W1LLM7_9BACL|nr:MBL fold metallo-hydrolase [Paenibacillus sambharensis]PZD95414.1 hypothetical protein DNH61_12825 [Paenibacillus sambharensis]